MKRGSGGMGCGWYGEGHGVVTVRSPVGTCMEKGGGDIGGSYCQDIHCIYRE